jgi:hypothetical protein
MIDVTGNSPKGLIGAMDKLEPKGNVSKPYSKEPIDIQWKLALLWKELKIIGESDWAETTKQASLEITRLRESK